MHVHVLKQIKMSTTDARGRGTAKSVVNTCKTKAKLDYCHSLEWTSLCVVITVSLYPTMLGMWVSMCIYCVCVCWRVSRRVVSCTAHWVTLGNLRNFHLRGGGNLEKRAQVPSEQETDHTLLESTLSPHLPVISVTLLRLRRSPVPCEYTVPPGVCNDRQGCMQTFTQSMCEYVWRERERDRETEREWEKCMFE